MAIKEINRSEVYSNISDLEGLEELTLLNQLKWNRMRKKQGCIRKW